MNFNMLYVFLKIVWSTIWLDFFSLFSISLIFGLIFILLILRFLIIICGLVFLWELLIMLSQKLRSFFTISFFILQFNLFLTDLFFALFFKISLYLLKTCNSILGYTWGKRLLSTCINRWKCSVIIDWFFLISIHIAICVIIRLA